MRSGLAAVAIMALVVAACGGGSDDTAPSDPSPESPTSSVGTIATTTDATTTSTTSAPTTTVDPTAALIAEIEADLNAGEQVFLAGAADPGSETSRKNLERYFSGEALERFVDFYDDLVADGLIARANPEIESVITVMAIVEQNVDDRVVVDLCRVDAGVIVDLLDDGSEAIVNDEVVRYEFRVPVVRSGGVWTSPGGETLSEQPGLTSCD